MSKTKEPLHPKLARLAQITKEIESAAKKRNPNRDAPVAFMAAGNEHLLDFGVIATGNPVVDPALGGGWPRGSIGSIAGAEGTGKTRLAFDTIAYNQKIDPLFIAAYIFLESRDFPLAAALAAGVNLERLVIINALSSAERTFDIAARYLWNYKTECPEDVIDFMVIDSVAAAVPEAELESFKGTASKAGTFANVTVGRQAAMMSKFLRDVAGTGMLGKCHLSLINQLRQKMDGGTVKSGGNAVGYYPKIIVDVRKRTLSVGKWGQADYKVLGHEVHGIVSKNNTGRAWPQAPFMYPIRYGVGVDFVVPIMELSIEKGIIIAEKGSWFSMPRLDVETGEVTHERINGRGQIEAAIRSDEGLFGYLQTAIANQATEIAAAAVAGNENPEGDVYAEADDEADLEVSAEAEG